MVNAALQRNARADLRAPPRVLLSQQGQPDHRLRLPIDYFDELKCQARFSFFALFVLRWPSQPWGRLVVLSAWRRDDAWLLWLGFLCCSHLNSHRKRLHSVKLNHTVVICL